MWSNCISYKFSANHSSFFPFICLSFYPQEHCATVCENLIWNKRLWEAATGKNENENKYPAHFGYIFVTCFAEYNILYR